MRTIQFYGQELEPFSEQQGRMDLALTALSVASTEMDAQNYRKSATALRAAAAMLDQLATINETSKGSISDENPET